MLARTEAKENLMKSIYEHERDILRAKQELSKLRVEFDYRESDQVIILEKQNGDLSNKYRITT